MFWKKDKNIRGSAKYKDGSWKIEFTENFDMDFNGLPDGAKDELMKFIKGVESGRIDPLKMGQRMCGYCGDPVEDIPKEGNIMCPNCQKSLV